MFIYHGPTVCDIFFHVSVFRCLTKTQSRIQIVEAEHFQLYKRAKHVFAESRRVLEFREVCLREGNADDTLRELGRLMDESHKSCSELCESSVPEVDLLCRLAKEAGAYGSRITGKRIRDFTNERRLTEKKN